MPAEIVNLRRARKAKAQSERQRQAETNRALFGRTKAEKTRQAAEREQAVRSMDNHHRDKE
jgi:hypothetical protein